MLTSRLKEARLRAGLSQERLGTLAGLDEMSASSRMNQYERGKHTPGFFLIERLAQALGMPTPWFYTRDDDMAELLLAYNALSPEQKQKALSYVRELSRMDAAVDSAGADGAARNGLAQPAGESATYSRSSLDQSQNRTPVRPPSADGQSRK